MDDNAPVGASVFTTLRWDGGCVAWLEEHLNRLRTHAKRLGIDWPEDFNERLASISPIGDGDLCQVKLNLLPIVSNDWLCLKN